MDNRQILEALNLLPKKTYVGLAIQYALDEFYALDHIVIMILQCAVDNKEMVKNYLGDELFKAIVNYQP